VSKTGSQALVTLLRSNGVEDIIREPVELSGEDLALVAGGLSLDIDIGELNIGIGQLNIDSTANLNTNIGIGENNGLVG
jgi:hypothetical protein